MTTHPEWEAAYRAYLGHRALLDLDNELGDVAEARRKHEISPRDPAVSGRRSKAELAHRRNFKDPLVDAVVAMINVPAPDLEAVAIKRKAAGRSAKSHPERMVAAFDLIAADIERLTGVAVSIADMRAAA